MTLNDLVKVYIIAHFGADNGPRNRERYRAGVTAVIEALRDEMISVIDGEESLLGFDIEERFREILGREAVLGDTACHSPEQHMPETASNDERKV